MDKPMLMDVSSNQDIVPGLLERRGGQLIVNAQMLAAIARGEADAPATGHDALVTALDEVCDCLQANGFSERLDVDADRIEIDFSTRPFTAAPSEPPVELRALAHRYARRLWDLSLQRLVERNLKAYPGRRWLSVAEGIWRYWEPQGHSIPEQGWKIHVSATPNSAPAVLDRCAKVLLRHGVAFKHAAQIQHVEMLSSAVFAREQGGKFITVYPRDAEEARGLVAPLDEATRGLPGPKILSDMAHGPNSLVHYRYGAFRTKQSLTNDGEYDDRLSRPDGGQESDLRKVGRAAPDWVEPLFPLDGGVQPGPVREVVLGGRFVVKGAIRHSNRGGVYRALDRRTDDEVVVKQARPHTFASVSGFDATAALRRESENLRLLAEVGPRHVDFFEEDGHHFLVQTSIRGGNLLEWITGQHGLAKAGPPGPPRPMVRKLVMSCCLLLHHVHGLGFVCRDFKPNNLMIDDDGLLSLIDPEAMERPGCFTYPIHTHGFSAPEAIEADEAGPCLAFPTDLYSLGATIYTLVTGGSPPSFVAGDSGAGLRTRWRVAASFMEERGYADLARLVLDLTDADPARRIGLEEAIARVSDEGMWREEGPVPDVAAPDHGPDGPMPTPEALFKRLAAHATRFIIDRREPLDSPRLWRGAPSLEKFDECGLQHGAAGVLGYLCRVDEREPSGALKQQVREASNWMEARLASRASFLPGLYYGAAGPVWANLLVARRLEDDALAARAIDLLLKLPTRWPNPDVCLGAAGVGLTLCRAWLDRGDRGLLEKIVDCADGLVETVKWNEAGLYWQVPDDFDSLSKGASHFGFAHGIAGIGYFLLMAGLVTGRQDYRDLAIATGDTLLAAAEQTGSGARWRNSVLPPKEPASELYYYWCNGSSGVGTFLVRLWRATGQDRFKAGAEDAARAVHAIRLQCGPSTCHGLAGNGEFLLDMAEFVDEQYAAWARDLALALVPKAIEQDGLLVIPESFEGVVSAEFGGGLAGIATFLDRLQSRRDRIWMLDELLRQPAG